MEFMQSQSDKSFDLAIVDPPYGIGYAAKPARSKHEKKNWDNDIPNDIYFDELFRISNKCIIWGGNYYKLPPCQCFIFWYKQNPVPNFSDGEFAWTNFNCPAMAVTKFCKIRTKNIGHARRKYEPCNSRT